MLIDRHLPEGQQDDKGYRATLKSAQLLQALDALDEALNSEQGQMVLYSLGLDANTFNFGKDGILFIYKTHELGTDALLLALEKWAKEQNK